MSALRRVAGVLLFVSLAVPRASAAQVPEHVPGIFIASERGPVELKAFAEEMSIGTLKIAGGTLADAPVVVPSAAFRMLSALPHWTPIGFMVGSETVFYDDRAERRNIKFAARRLSVYAIELRVADLETVESVARLLRAVRASPRAPGYAFLILTSNGINRYYAMRLQLEPDQ